MRDNKLKINPPLYLIGKKIHCWNCDNKMPAIALLAPNVDDSEGEIYILSDIQELPKDVYFFIKNRVPSFRMKYSKMAGHKYLGNTCPKCGLLSGEFFLHAEPGGPFFREDERNQIRITLSVLKRKRQGFLCESPGRLIYPFIIR